MKSYLLALMVVLPLLGALPAQAQVVAPFESEAWSTAANAVDTAVFATLQKRGAAPLVPCSDEVFIRRVYLDVTGTVPDGQAVFAFLQDHKPDKRAALIDSLLQKEEFADYSALRWGDVLRIKSEFPINLWPNAVQAYHRWVHDAIRANMPYDQFVRELLTASGSNFRVPPVNFYRAIQGRNATAIASAVALTFMGQRIDAWPKNRRADLEAFFSRVAYKGTAEWKEEIVYSDPAATAPIKTTFPDGTAVEIPADQDPRQVFADWLTGPGNNFLTRAVVNRLWFRLMGRGIVHEPDDFRGDNPAACPELITVLQKELLGAHYDLRQVYRVILNSRTYQSSSLTHGAPPKPEVLFAHYTVRRLDAEVLIDFLCWLGAEGEDYQSQIPEPFTFIPNDLRTIALPDGSITSSFLETFGRPSRDTGLESERNNQPSDAQRLYLLNSVEVRRRIENSPRLRTLAASAKGDRQVLVGWIYLAILSRQPTPGELAALTKYAQTPGLTLKQAMDDLAWALINSKEFLYRH
jgi:hypothetical protein